MDKNGVEAQVSGRGVHYGSGQAYVGGARVKRRPRLSLAMRHPQSGRSTTPAKHIPRVIVFNLSFCEALLPVHGY
jgi:hypothetical protein